MFIESKTDGASDEGWFDKLGRRHPRLFTTLLFALMVAVTIALLLKPNYTLVLYQGF